MGKRLNSRKQGSRRAEKGHALSHKAFTLTEMLVVMVVIGILFTGVANKFDNLTDKSKVTGVQADFREFYKAVKAVGLEKPLYTLTSAEFEERLNRQLDDSLQFANGICYGTDPWKTAYRYATKIEDETFYLLFSSNGGSYRQEFSLDDEIHALGDEEGSDIIFKEEFDARLNLYIKQQKTKFYAMGDDEHETEVKAALEEEVENLIRHAAFSYVNVYNGSLASPSGTLTATRNDDTVKFAAGEGITLTVSPNKIITIASTEGAGIRNELQTVQNYVDAHKNDGLAHLTSTEREIWNNAAAHADAAHAPSNAERNTIVGITVNGAAAQIDGSRKVNITVPTKLSQLANDADLATNASVNQLITNLNQNVVTNNNSLTDRIDGIQNYIEEHDSMRRLGEYVMTSAVFSIQHEYLVGCESINVNFAEQYNLVPEYVLDTATGSLTITAEGTLPTDGAVIQSIEVYY